MKITNFKGLFSIKSLKINLLPHLFNFIIHLDLFIFILWTN